MHPLSKSTLQKLSIISFIFSDSILLLIFIATHHPRYFWSKKNMIVHDISKSTNPRFVGLMVNMLKPEGGMDCLRNQV